jgi:nicotinamide-nucleotide amidase
MIVELINTGSELLLGRVLNTNQQWLCRQLAELGCVVSRQVAVPDTGPDIQGAVRESLGRADLVITTGGLGPTSDDLTRDLIARLLGRRLREDPRVLGAIQAYFVKRQRPMPESNRVQALVPEGARVLDNAFGTAPGLALEVRPNPYRAGGEGSWLVMLPGPPRELRPMFTDQVVPLLRGWLPPEARFACHTLRTTGLGESMVQERIAPALESLVARGLEVGYCARPGQVDVRLSARGPQGEALVVEGERIVRGLIGDYCYGTEEEELERVIISSLTARKATLAVAESCTGGCIAHRLTNVPGASAVFLAGLVTYSNNAKQKFLGVQPQTLAAHGAVSEAVAREMAEGARRTTGADYGIGVTGIAGPSGGTPDKPVGTVFLAVATPRQTRVERQCNPTDRETFKQVAAQQAMDLLRRTLHD